MQDLVVSVSENVLKISTVEGGEFKGVSAEISQDVVSNHEILNIDEFSNVMRDLIGTVTKKSFRNLGLTFLVEPHDVILKFITVPKNGQSLEDTLVNETKARVNEFPLEDLYFSYIKVAPFVYQFIGIHKQRLELYIELSNKLGIGLRGVFPWITFLPKIVNTNEPAIFLSKHSGKQVIALSEMGGIFYSGIYEKEKSTEELQKLVQDLAVYKRSNPISKVYIYDYEGFSLNPGYEILNIEIPNSDLQEAEGYELHLLLNQMISADSSLLSSKYNLLTHLPVPVIAEKKNLMPVYVGSAVLVAAVLSFVGYSVIAGNKPSQEVLENQSQNTEVLSDNSGSQPAAQVEEEPKEVLNKEDLTIRVENGAGIAGIAGLTQTFLEEKGYTVASIGNADIVGQTSTSVSFKTDTIKYQDMLVGDMQGTFESEVDADLDAAADYDVLITVGTDANL